MRTPFIYTFALMGVFGIHNASTFPATDGIDRPGILEKPFEKAQKLDDDIKKRPAKCHGRMEEKDRVVRLMPKPTSQCAHIHSECSGILIENDVMLTAAHCLFGEAPKHGTRPRLIDCPDKCWKVVDNAGNTRDISIALRHIGYKQHIEGQKEGMYRGDIAVVYLESGLPTPEAIGCLAPGVCAKRTEKCWIYKHGAGGEIYKEQVIVDRCDSIDYNGCDEEDTLCLFDLSMQKINASKGQSGSPIVCEENVEGKKFYVRGVLSQKHHDDTFMVFSSARKMNLISFRGC